MMRQAICRPIEITAANKTITISGTDYVVAERVYANIFDLLNTIKATAIDACYLNASWRVCIRTTGGGTAALTKTALSDILGFNGTESGSTTRIATYAPAFAWASSYQHGTPERWATDSEMEFHGSMAADGNLCGVSMTTRERLTIKWPWEFAANAYPRAATLSYTDSASGIRYPEQYSNFWSVATGSRSAYLTNVSSQNVSNKGLYYFPYVNDFLGETSTFNYTSHLWNSGGLNFDIATASNKDNYCFCTCEAPKLPTSRENLLQYYDVEIAMTSAVAPLWKFPT
jgi:hypothetical protein